MAIKYKAKMSTSSMSNAALGFVSAGFFLMTLAQPACAQTPGPPSTPVPVVPGIVVTDFDVINNTNAIAQELGLMATTITGMQLGQSQVHGMLADGQVASHAYEQNTVGKALDMANTHYVVPSINPTSGMPDTQYNSACAHSQGVAQQVTNKSKSKMLAKAFGAARFGAPSATNIAAKFKRDSANGFIPCGADEEGKINAALGCTPGADPARPRMSRTMDALFKHEQLPVPDDMAKPTNVGVYTPFPTLLDSTSNPKKYTPAYAAVGFCENIAPPPPILPTVNGQTGTVAMIAIAAQKAAQESQDSKITSLCWDDFTERMQVAQTSQNFQDKYIDQATLCQYDFDKHIISAAANQDCQINGRSDLQAKKDRYNRISNPDYSSLVLATLPAGFKEQEERVAEMEAEAFDNIVSGEVSTFVQAMPGRHFTANESQASVMQVQ